MGEELIVVGGGGIGRETLELVNAVNAVSPGRYRVAGVADDSLSEENLALVEDLAVPYLGPVAALPTVSSAGCRFVIGIANPAIRRRLDAAMLAKGYAPAILIHPSATVGSSVTLGPGSIVCPGARLTTNIVTGRHVHLHVNTTVGHDSRLADFVSLYPQAGVAGNCELREGATVGSNASVLQGLELGAESFVGAGAVVVRNVAAGSVVKGVPAR